MRTYQNMSELFGVGKEKMRREGNGAAGVMANNGDGVEVGALLDCGESAGTLG